MRRKQLTRVSAPEDPAILSPWVGGVCILHTPPVLSWLVRSEGGLHTTLWAEPDHLESLGITNRFSTTAARPQIVPGPLPLRFVFLYLALT